MPPDDADRHHRHGSSCAGDRSRAPASPAQAAELAARVEVPLQDAKQLVRAGFPPDVAFQLLASGERPVF